MFTYWKSRRAARAAERQFQLALLESLIAENRAEMDRLAELEECRWCKERETAEEREVCAGG